MSNKDSSASGARIFLGVLALLATPFVLIIDMIGGIPAAPDLTLMWLLLTGWLLLHDVIKRAFGGSEINVDKKIEHKKENHHFGYNDVPQRPVKSRKEDSNYLVVIPQPPPPRQRNVDRPRLTPSNYRRSSRD